MVFAVIFAPSSSGIRGWWLKSLIMFTFMLRFLYLLLAILGRRLEPAIQQQWSILISDLHCSLIPCIPFPFCPSVPPTDTSPAQPFLKLYRHQPLTLFSPVQATHTALKTCSHSASTPRRSRTFLHVFFNTLPYMHFEEGFVRGCCPSPSCDWQVRQQYMHQMVSHGECVHRGGGRGAHTPGFVSASSIVAAPHGSLSLSPVWGCVPPMLLSHSGPLRLVVRQRWEKPSDENFT